MNCRSVVMTFSFEWMSLLFVGFVFIISSLFVLYSDDYIFGDLCIFLFILFFFMFAISIMFFIVSPNMISIVLGWDGLGLVSYLLVIYYHNVKSYGAGKHSDVIIEMFRHKNMSIRGAEFIGFTDVIILELWVSFLYFGVTSSPPSPPPTTIILRYEDYARGYHQPCLILSM